MFIKNIDNNLVYRITASLNDLNLFQLERDGVKIIANKEELKKKYYLVKSGVDKIDYFKELNNIKDKVLKRVNKINQAQVWTKARLNMLEKDTPEYLKIQNDDDKYSEDLKRWNKVLEEVKDEIVDFQALQSRVNLERQITLSDLYAKLGLKPEEIEDDIDVSFMNDDSKLNTDDSKLDFETPADSQNNDVKNQ